ncbi:MAG: universal stress protein [Bacteroidota bacterium]
MVFKKLGLAITFSPNAKALLKTAKRLQELFSAQLCLIHVGDKNKSTEAQLFSLLDDVGIDENKYEMVWQNGDPSKVIIDTCSAKGVDLLIAGALEKESMLKYYIGSVARTIMREAECSVLILTKPTEEQKPFQEFFVLVEYSEVGENAVRKAYQFALLENAKELGLIKEIQTPGLAITISDGSSTQETEKRRTDWQYEEELKLRVFAKEMKLGNINLKTVCLYGKQGWESSNYVKQNGGEIFVVPSPTKKLKLFDRIFQHDLEFIIKQIPCALLIIKEKYN